MKHKLNDFWAFKMNGGIRETYTTVEQEDDVCVICFVFEYFLKGLLTLHAKEAMPYSQQSP